MKKRIVLCADDYGQEPVISRGIIDLVDKGRLSAVSCMVNRPDWREQAGWLVPYVDRVDIGLHFNLTDGEPLSERYRSVHGGHFFSLSELLKKSFLRQVSRDAMLAECLTQLDAFAEAMGRLPDFIDGHQHVHQFPVIRHAIIQAYQARFPSQQAYIRLVNHQVGLGNVKKAIIYLSGTRALKALLVQYGIPHNHSFSGVYDFKHAARYAAHFNTFLHEVEDGGLIMCHPGFKSDSQQDPIADARFLEYTYLSGDKFQQDCQRNDAQLSRMPLRKKS